MSTDADRIRKLRERMTHYLLHGVGDASEEAVEGNILAEEAREVIDQLTAELAVIRAALGVSNDFKLDALVIAIRQMRSDNAAHERTKAELAKAHQARASYSAQARDALRERDDALNERDAAQAKLASVEAECERMRAEAIAEHEAWMSTKASVEAEAAARLELIGDAALFLRSARLHLEGTAVEGTPWFDGLVHLTLVLEKAKREPSALAVRVPLLEAVANDAREMERRATGKALLPTPEQWQQLTKDLAALDEKGGAGTAGRTLAARLPLLEAVAAMVSVLVETVQKHPALIGDQRLCDMIGALAKQLAALDEKGPTS